MDGDSYGTYDDMDMVPQSSVPLPGPREYMIYPRITHPRKMQTRSPGETRKGLLNTPSDARRYILDSVGFEGRR